ncbi:MAG: hypothetical protein ACI9OJ_005876 [Myxococcota bacterium]|jgi:hypothetical protein
MSRCTPLVLVALVSGCGAFDFEIERPIDEVRVEGDPDLSGLRVPAAEDLIPPQVWEADLPQEPAGIFLERMELTITNGGRDDGDDDFAFVDSVVFYASPTAPGTELERHPLAWISREHEGIDGQTLSLTPNRALNLVPYIVEGFEVTSTLVARVPPSDLTLEGTATLSVDLL